VVLVTASPNEEQAFTGPGDARPKRSDVDLALRKLNQAIRQRVAQAAEDWDRTRLYIYVSGHGIAPPTNAGAVLMADAERDVLGECIELAMYGQWYESCGIFRELVVLADCCRERPRGAPPGMLPPFNLCQTPYGRTTRVLGYATGFGELAFEPLEAEHPDEQRGFFTKALLEGLRGAAAVDPDLGGITSETLAVYVTKAVEEMTKDQPVRQRAQILVEAGNPILLRATAVQQRPRWTVTIALPAGFSGQAVLRDGDNSEIARHDAGTPWQLELDEGLYGVFPPNGRNARPIGLFEVLGGDTDVQL
jgi:hypothetical protein